MRETKESKIRGLRVEGGGRGVSVGEEKVICTYSSRGSRKLDWE